MVIKNDDLCLKYFMGVTFIINVGNGLYLSFWCN